MIDKSYTLLGCAGKAKQTSKQKKKEMDLQIAELSQLKHSPTVWVPVAVQ